MMWMCGQFCLLKFVVVEETAEETVDKTGDWFWCSGCGLSELV